MIAIILTADVGALYEGLGADELVARLVDAPAGLARALGGLEAAVLVADGGHEAALAHRLAAAAQHLVHLAALGGQAQEGVLHVRLDLRVDFHGGVGRAGGAAAAAPGLPEVALGLTVARQRALDRLALLVNAPADAHVLQALDRLPGASVRVASATKGCNTI